jgi:hypothetical protein
MGLENTAIQSLSESPADDQKATTVTRVRFCSSTVVAQPSTLLHVCRTSRGYVLSIYTACIEPPGFDHKIRLRPKKDILVLREYDGIPSRRYLEMGETGTFSNISVVALHVPLKEGSMGDARSQGIEGILEIFPKLEKLLVFPISEDLASLKILTIQGHKYFIRPIIEGDHIRSNKARGTLGYYNPTIDVVRRDRESMQSAVHKMRRLHAAKGNEQGELAEDRLIKVEFVCVCLGAVNLKAVHGSSQQDW